MLSMAISLAGCGAYFSVWGLSQLFAGASLSVIIMASILELSKLIVTTALHTYWYKLAKTLNVFLTINDLILISNYRGADPAVGATTSASRGVSGFGFDYGNMGAPIGFNFGIRASF